MTKKIPVSVLLEAMANLPFGDHTKHTWVHKKVSINKAKCITLTFAKLQEGWTLIKSE